MSDALYKKLTESFPIEAYKVDKSRGFELTSLDAQYIKDRLNETFGIFGWEFQERFTEVEKEVEVEERDPVKKTIERKKVLRSGIVCHGILTIFHPDDNSLNRHIQATGGCSYKSKGQNLSDIYKSAATESLSKAASYIGIGGEMYKGLVDPKVISKERGNFEAALKAAKTAKSESEKKRIKVLTDQYKWDIGEVEQILKVLEE
jgi:hypothetical protein